MQGNEGEHHSHVQASGCPLVGIRLGTASCGDGTIGTNKLKRAAVTQRGASAAGSFCHTRQLCTRLQQYASHSLKLQDISKQVSHTNANRRRVAKQFTKAAFYVSLDHLISL